MGNKKSNPKQTLVKNYIDLLYMTPSEISAKDIASLLQNNKELKVQLWEGMNVLEIELSNENSVDFEPLDISFKEPTDISFVRNRNIKTIFVVSICDSDISSMTPYFEQLVSQFNGFVCADSADFYPVYAGSSKKY